MSIPIAFLDLDNRPGWHHHAACRATGNEPFFRTRGHTITAARQVCAGCPVQAECRAYATATHQRFGVWGGLRATDLRPGRLPAALAAWDAWLDAYWAGECRDCA